MGPKTVKIEVWRGSGRSWKRSWHENRLAGCLGRFWPILDRRGMPKMAARWPNLAPRWGQDDAKMVPRCDLCKKGRIIKMSTTMAFRPHFQDLGGLGECTWRLLEATLGDLGHKLASLGRSWRRDGNFLATCCEKVGRRWPKMANLSQKSE